MTQFTFRGLRHEVYRHPFIIMRGISGDWITSEGVLVQIGEEDKRGASELILRGTSDISLVPGLRVSAVKLDQPGGRPERAVPVDFRVNGSDYTISVPLTGLNREPGLLFVKLSFSTSFVPRDVGMGTDARRLVIWAPRERRLVLEPLVMSSGR